MISKATGATILMAAVLLGCKGPVSTSVASIGGAGDGSSAGSAGTVSSASGSRVESIPDPSLNNMAAFSVMVPAKWQFQGVLFQGDSCQNIPMAVYRATSQDGHSFAEEMPGMAWTWGTGPMVGFAPKNDCLPLKGPMGAQDFLKYLAGTMKVDYVGPEAVPAALNAKAQEMLQKAVDAIAPKWAAMHAQAPKNTRELARAMVRYQNGTTPMKGRLQVIEDCMETYYPGGKTLSAYGGPGRPAQIVQGPPSTVDKCTVGVSYVTGPEAQFDALVRQWDSASNGLGAHAEDAWQEEWIQRNAQETQQRINQMWANTRSQMQARQVQFDHDQAVRQQMHNQFMQTMQEGTDRSMARTQAAMNARSTSTSDWVDYALDRQTVVNTNNGLMYKIPNQVTVQQPLQQVHGDGTPY